MDNSYLSMNYTLEEHFKDYSEKYEQVKEVYSLWILLKKDITEKLNNVYRTFPYFSKHDASHSNTIITNIELFLGEQRIRMLSATDTFMILICAYSHDIGMALELDEIFEILKDSDGSFQKFLKENNIDSDSAERLKQYYNKNESDGDLKELCYSIIISLQEYNRTDHWKGVEKIETCFNSLFLNRIKARFVKSIINICKMHGRNVEDISELSIYSTGMFADLFHPRFIAAMIRLGDLLDLDNNRFSQEFFKSFGNKSEYIPNISEIHYLKHESITHFFIGPNHIDVEASCKGDKALDVARELYEWLHWLEDDCNYYKTEWDMIAPRDFGVAPRLRTKKILVKGTEYQHFEYNLKMELPHDRIFNLLAGSNVYDSRFTAFREIIQNAVDATLLQLWSDYYNSLSPEKQDNLVFDTDFSKSFASKCLSEKFFNDYRIHVEVIESIKENAVYVEIIDQGIGIDDEDLKYMSRIGENSICNPQKHKLIETMPDWLVPSGVFGIGLQSAFQLSDKIEFFTKKANRTPRHICFSSYSINKGKIEVSKCPNTFEKEFKKLSTQGTLVRIKIKPNIFNNEDSFDYYDIEFDRSEINAHVIRVEIIKQLNRYFSLNTNNYFPITFSDYSIDENGVKKYTTKKNGKVIVNKVFYNRDLYESLNSDKGYTISKMKGKGKNSKKICYFSRRKNLLLTVVLPRCKMIDDTHSIVHLDCLDNSFSLKYKYNNIEDYRQLFSHDFTDINQAVKIVDKNYYRSTIDILDKNTEKYVNIDRNVLKRDSITYEDIIQINNELFSLLCNDLINENKEIKYLASKDYLPILTIIFSRFLEKKQLNRFVESKKYELNELFIRTISDEKYVPLLNFIGYGISSVNISDCNNIIIDSKELSYEDFFEEFPEHYFVPTKISSSTDKEFEIYHCSIKETSKNHPINCCISTMCHFLTLLPPNKP